MEESFFVYGFVGVIYDVGYYFCILGSDIFLKGYFKCRMEKGLKWDKYRCGNVS